MGKYDKETPMKASTGGAPVGCLHCFLDTVMYEAITGSGDCMAANTNTRAQHCLSTQCATLQCCTGPGPLVKDCGLTVL